MAEASPTDVDDASMASDIVPPVTAAIDFGTTNSGFAFKFEDDADASNVQINKWIGGSSDVEKTPTTVLLKEDKSFHSFGLNAENEYADLCQNQEQKGWRYFHHFKMALYRNKKITRDMEIYDTENKPMAALEVLSLVLCHLKVKILEKVRLQRRQIEDDDVKYVITVPAIWSDAAKQMMREAATHPSVGIRDDKLKLVLEPEAASVYCALRPTERRQGSQDFQKLPEGSKYIIVDIGGGTLDVATHEIVSDGRILESYIARGSDKGGQYFNETCLNVFEGLFGKDCFNKWKSTECNEFLELERSIEAYKRMVGTTEKDFNFSINDLLLDLFNEMSEGENIERFPIKCSKAVRSCSNETGCITLKYEFFKHILEEIADEVVRYLEPVFEEIPSIACVYFVGGLANSDFLRNHVKGRFPNCVILVPEDHSVAVLKGAVFLGNRPQITAGRISRYSYGVAITEEFVEKKHKQEYKFVRDGTVLCRNVFKKLIDKGKVLEYGQTFPARTCVNARQPDTKKKTFETYIYQSTQASPMYVTDDGCCKLGGFKEPPPQGGWPDYCGSTLEIKLGGTLDIAAHEILSDNRLNEVSVARGNDMGGHYFNNKCLEVFEEMFGEECLQKWKAKYCNDFLEMERKIEEMKRNVSTSDSNVLFRVKRPLLNIYKDISGGNGIENFEIEFCRYVESSTRKKGYLILKNEFLRNVVKQVAMAIETYLTEIITDIPSMEIIFMVGGLSKSTFVRQYIETRFPKCKVIVPEDPGVAVLKGAVLLGYRPKTIASRVARYSYGIGGKEESKVNNNGKIRWNCLFVKMIEKGQVLKYGDTFKTTTRVFARKPEAKQATLYTYLYLSTQQSPVYITDEGCSKLGGFDIHPPKGGWPDTCELTTEIMVGEAEFRLVHSDDFGRRFVTKTDYLLQ